MAVVALSVRLVEVAHYVPLAVVDEATRAVVGIAGIPAAIVTPP